MLLTYILDQYAALKAILRLSDLGKGLSIRVTFHYPAF
jgi:hypothetical protein